MSWEMSGAMYQLERLRMSGNGANCQVAGERWLASAYRGVGNSKEGREEYVQKEKSPPLS